MANPTIVQTGSGGVAATAFNVTLGTLTGAAVGDLVIAWGTAERNSATPVILGGSGAWTLLTTMTNTNHCTGVYYKRLGSGDLTATIVADLGAVGRRLVGGFISLRGSLDPVYNAKAAVTAATTAFSANAMTPTVADSLLLTLFTSVATGTPFTRTVGTHTSSFVERVQVCGTAAASSNTFTVLATKALTGGTGVAQTFDAATASSASEYNALSIVAAPGTVNAAPTASISADKTTAVEPGETVTLTLTDGDDVAVVTRTLRQIGATNAPASGSGSTRTIVAPYTLAGTTLQYGYKVNDGTLDSTEAIVSIAVLPSEYRLVTVGGPTPTEVPLAITLM
jgi:hypothetical protein